MNETYLLRISNRKLDELERLQRVQSIEHVPKIYSQGEIEIKGKKYHYLIMDFIQGVELNTFIQSLTHEQSINIGKGRC